MTKKGTVVLILILALIALIGGWFYFDYLSAPRAQAPAEDINESGEQRMSLVGDIYKNWSTISQSIPIKAMDSGKWFLNGVRMIGPSVAMVAFEDGLNGNVAILDRSGSDYVVKKVYENRLQFTATELESMQKEYGAADYTPLVYETSEGNGMPAKIDLDIFLKSTNTIGIKIALLNPDGNLPNEVKPGDISGCDHVVLVERQIPKTQTPLTAALGVLLGKGDDGGLYNYANRGTLTVDSVNIANGTAKIYLKGNPPPLAGVCDDPRLFVQIAQTARQFPTVQKVQLFVNGVENTGSGNESGL